MLLSAAEKLEWPNVVNYSSASVQDRKSFEESFLELLKLQKECVASAVFQSFSSSDVLNVEEKDYMLPTSYLPTREMVFIQFKLWYNLSRCDSSIILKVPGKPIGLIRYADSLLMSRYFVC